MAAIDYFTQYFRYYLVGRRFICRTDHCALKWLFSIEPVGKYARWLMRLAEFDMYVMYLPGKQNTVADALSRIMEKPTLEGMVEHLQLTAPIQLKERKLYIRPENAEGRLLNEKDAFIGKNEKHVRQRPNKICTDIPGIAYLEEPAPTIDTIVGQAYGTYMVQMLHDASNEVLMVSDSVTDGLQTSIIEWPTREEYDWVAQQQGDIAIKTICDHLTEVAETCHNGLELSRPDPDAVLEDPDYDFMVKHFADFIQEDGLLYHCGWDDSETIRTKLRLVVPIKLQHILIADVHTYTGHRSTRSLIKTLTDRYWWRTLRKDVTEYC